MLKDVVRTLLFAVLVLLMVGFGLCGVVGTTVGLSHMREVSEPGPEDLGAFWLECGLAGLGVACVSGLCLFLLLRSARKPKQ